jgi:hypothetical protein
MNEITAAAVAALTVYQAALVALGHVVARAADGSYEVEAGPGLADEFGGVPEADHLKAEAAVAAAHAAGERSGRRLGVVFLPGSDRIVGEPVDLDAVVARGGWPVYS